MKPVKSERCCGYLRTDGYFDIRCSKRGTKEYGGLVYCGTHYPPAKKSSQEARMKKREESWAISSLRKDLHKLERTCLNKLVEWVIQSNPTDPKAKKLIQQLSGVRAKLKEVNEDPAR